MKLSKYFAPTLREIPKECSVRSHELMVKAGLIMKLTSGFYSFLPMGYRVIKKIEKIVREEMDRIGSQEVFMPAMAPKELWQETGRWEIYGELMMKCTDRTGRQYCLCPTHEEVITDIVRSHINSYKKLPVILYQIQEKFRDELRPRGGVLRCKEFSMKDAYSFHDSIESLNQVYDDMYTAYVNIFKRSGLAFRAVEADPGPIGGEASHEFMVLAHSGEDKVLTCSHCQYAANIEKAECFYKNSKILKAEVAKLEKIHTPDIKTISDLSNFFNTDESKILKALIYVADNTPVMFLIRGDHELNETKAKNFLKANQLKMASSQLIEKITGAKAGFSGPINLKEKINIIADFSVKFMGTVITGANENDMHFKNAVLSRDFNVTEFADIRNATEEDICPRCKKGKYKFEHGIEVGHIFKLGIRYSKDMNATFLDKNGKKQPFIMGCYGIGIARIMAAAIEQNNDKDGIIWPVPIAPFHVIIVPVNSSDSELMEYSFKIYNLLNNNGIETLIDDRNERPGVKFKDADLYGIPVRLTLSEKLLKEGKIELKLRKTGEISLITENKLIHRLKNILWGENDAC